MYRKFTVKTTALKLNVELFYLVRLQEQVFFLLANLLLLIMVTCYDCERQRVILTVCQHFNKLKAGKVVTASLHTDEKKTILFKVLDILLNLVYQY